MKAKKNSKQRKIRKTVFYAVLFLKIKNTINTCFYLSVILVLMMNFKNTVDKIKNTVYNSQYK